MRGMSEARGSFDTLVSLHSARLTKKISAAGPHSQSAILSAKPALLTNHQQSKISSVRRVQSFSRTDKLVVPLFPQSSTQASLNTTPLTAFVRPPRLTFKRRYFLIYILLNSIYLPIHFCFITLLLVA